MGDTLEMGQTVKSEGATAGCPTNIFAVCVNSNCIYYTICTMARNLPPIC